MLAETEFDRVAPGARTFRSLGARGTVVELRLPGAELRRPIGLATARSSSPAGMGRVPRAEDVPSEPAVHQLLTALAATGGVSADLAASVVADEPERFVRLWTVMRPLYEHLATSASLKQIGRSPGCRCASSAATSAI